VFGKGIFDPSQQAEAKSRLVGFEGAQAISSNAYFGRPDEDDAGEDYGDLESAAKDFVRKFGITAADDIDSLTRMAGQASGKLQDAVKAYLGN
jgi:ADP-ribosylation factor GTPase-activating protein 2/3